jgi:hypothetical protein
MRVASKVVFHSIVSSNNYEEQQRGSTAAMQMELERLRSELRRALNNGQQWQQLHQELYCFCVDELMGGNKEEGEEKEAEKEAEKGKGRGKVSDKTREK